MTRKSQQNRWVFQGFCTDGQDLGKAMVKKIAVVPPRATYFENGNILFDPLKEKLSIDSDHIITEHPSRLPEEWIKSVLPNDAAFLEGESSSQYDERVGSLLSHNIGAKALLKNNLDLAKDISLMRCQWNYKTAIPYYDPKSKNIGWFLPLCTQSKDGLIPFAALVVTKEESGRYQGQTIYKLSWAYRCARLVCRPDSDWLSPLSTSEDDGE